MKIQPTIFLLFLLTANAAFGQFVPPNTEWDTIFVANLESNSPDEPTNLNPSQPTGYDLTWVNYDQDGLDQTCDTTTHGWYGRFESTFPDESENYCFTSCSFLNNDYAYNPCLLKNRNWLIMPPVTISGDNAQLNWKSSSFYGPFGLDGYKVLVSTSTNLIESFNDTIFVAAEMIRPIGQFGILNADKYIYSPGYIHADKYQLGDYYGIDQDVSGFTFWHGKLEPHTVNLSEYMGQTIYIAFLHDSQCDFQLQIDDILVVENITDATHEKSEIAQMSIRPNPIEDHAFLDISMRSATECSIILTNLQGQVMQNLTTITTLNETRKSIPLDLTNFPDGTYFCNIVTNKGKLTRKIVKI
jgi:Secretion system C-terminal sorting domain